MHILIMTPFKSAESALLPEIKRAASTLKATFSYADLGQFLPGDPHACNVLLLGQSTPQIEEVKATYADVAVVEFYADMEGLDLLKAIKDAVKPAKKTPAKGKEKDNA